MTRRYLLSALGAGTAAGAWARFVEPKWFEVTHTRLPLANVKPRRILHLSDLHVSDGLTAEDLEVGLKAGLAERPDFICITGDFISNDRTFDVEGLGRLLRKAADAAPTYAVMGNHDRGLELLNDGVTRSSEPLREFIAAAGVRVLHNESVIEGDLNLVGSADLWSGELAPQTAFQEVGKGRPTILLCHNPDAKTLYAKHQWNAMLAGHTHGGQARIPGITPAWAPVTDKRYIAGLYEWEGRKLFITRGLGSPKHVRAFCRPEVSILHVG